MSDPLRIRGGEVGERRKGAEQPVDYCSPRKHYKLGGAIYADSRIGPADRRSDLSTAARIDEIIQATRGPLIRALEEAQAEIAGLEMERELHAEINRRVAMALGRDRYATWHDMPEEVANLRRELDRYRKAIDTAAKHAYRVELARTGEAEAKLAAGAGAGACAIAEDIQEVQ